MEPILDPEYRDLEEALLRAGRDVSMSSELQAKTLQAIGLTAAGAGTAAATKAGFLGGKAGALWTAGLVGAAGLIGSFVVTSAENEGPSSQITQISAGESVDAPAPDPERPPAHASWSHCRARACDCRFVLAHRYRLQTRSSRRYPA